MEQQVQQAGQVMEQILQSLLSSDNLIRTEAERKLNQEWAKQQPEQCLQGLGYVMQRAEQPEMRGFAAVLLRRIGFREELQGEREGVVWNMVGEETKHMVKGMLLGALEGEANIGVRHKVSDTVAEVVNYGEEWPALLGGLIGMSGSGNAQVRESAYRIFSGSPQVLLGQDLESVKHAFINAFQDSEAAVRLAALKAGVQVMVESGEDTERRKLEGMIPAMLGVVEKMVRVRDEEGMVDSLSAMTELAEGYARGFKGAVLGELLGLAEVVGGNREYEDGSRQAAVELLVTLAEAGPGMCRRQKDFCGRLVPVILGMLAELEESEEWGQLENMDEEDEEGEDMAGFGEQALDRVSCAMGGKLLLPVAFQAIQAMLGSGRWQDRHAGLMGISAIGEGSYKMMKNELGSVVQLACQFVKDSHPRVRYAACNALGQLSTDFAPIIQDKYHSEVVQQLVGAMGDVQNPRVQAHAAAAMVNFCEEASKSVIEPYLDGLFEQLLMLLQSPKRYVQEQAITTTATVADSAKELFRKHYGAIVPQLLNVLQNAEGREYRLLRGKAMECVTFIAVAVEWERFSGDAEQLIAILLKIQSEISEDDDPQISYLLAAWARLCKVMKERFLVYLPQVMPSLLKSARMQPDFAVVDGDDDPNEQYAAEDGWEFASVSGQQIGIRTSALEEKCTAIEMLLCYARELGSGFGPYAVETLDLVMPLFNFYFHEGVRFASAAVVPHCLAALVGNVDSATSVAVFGRVVDAYLKAMIGESDDMTFVSQLFMTFSECLMVAGPGCLNGDQQQRVYQVMVELFEKVLASINSRNGNKSAAAAAQGQGQGQGGNEDEEADVDVEVDDEMVLAENEAMDSISKCIRTIVKLHPGFVPYIDSLFPYFMQFSNDSTGYGLQWSLCVYDDLIEMMGPLSFKYAPSTFFPIFSTGISAIPTSPDVAQACLYGVGLMAQYGGQEYYPAIVSQFLPAIKSILLHHLSQKKAPAANVEDEEGYIFAIENATSSLLKIVLNLHDYLVSSNISVPDLLLLWFNSMPILQDDEEATLNYQFLLSLLTSSSSSPSSPSPSSLSFTSQIASKYPLASLLSLIPNNPTPAAIDSLVHLSTMVVDSLVLDFLPRDLGSQLLAGLNSFISSYSSSQDVKSQVWSRIPLDKQLSLHKLGYI